MGFRKIQLGGRRRKQIRGYALVDDEDYEKISKHIWCYTKAFRTAYAVRFIYLKNGRKRRVVMHREIIKIPKGKVTDHINGNGLDNRRKNLRSVTQRQNVHNSRINLNNTSGYKGVCFLKKAKNKPWLASIRHKPKKIILGTFATKEEAHRAYVKASRKLRGKYARFK